MTNEHSTQEDKWQQIATVPIDGTEVLVHAKDRRGRWQCAKVKYLQTTPYIDPTSSKNWVYSDVTGDLLAYPLEPAEWQPVE